MQNNFRRHGNVEVDTEFRIWKIVNSKSGNHVTARVTRLLFLDFSKL